MEGYYYISIIEKQKPDCEDIDDIEQWYSDKYHLNLPVEEFRQELRQHPDRHKRIRNRYVFVHNNKHFNDLQNILDYLRKRPEIYGDVVLDMTTETHDIIINMIETTLENSIYDFNLKLSFFKELIYNYTEDCESLLDNGHSYDYENEDDLRKKVAMDRFLSLVHKPRAKSVKRIANSSPF